MKCFSCGDDANMKVIISVNGELEQVDICEKCYKEHVQKMMDYMKGEDGKFDPEKMQSAMFDIINNNKDKLEEMLGYAFNIENFNLDNIDFKNIKFEDLDIEDLTNFTKNSGFMDPDSFENFNPFKMGTSSRGINGNPNLYEPETDQKLNKSENFSSQKTSHYNKGVNPYNTKADRVNILQQSIARKKKQLDQYVDSEDYLAAASMRDQIRDINREIMFILELESK